MWARAASQPPLKSQLTSDDRRVRKLRRNHAHVLISGNIFGFGKKSQTG